MVSSDPGSRSARLARARRVRVLGGFLKHTGPRSLANRIIEALYTGGGEAETLADACILSLHGEQAISAQQATYPITPSFNFSFT